MSAAMPLAPPSLSLAELGRELGRAGARVEGDPATRIEDVRQDSRAVEPGDLFVARRGRSADGAAFCQQAVSRGAVAILAGHSVRLPALGVPVLRVEDAELGLALAAEAVHGHPSRALEVVGITGTNGKTTTAWITSHLLDAAGASAARVGTLGYAFGDDQVHESLTTPSADEVSRFAARALARGASHLVMEVSSHALAQKRVDAIRFAAAAFTNLSQDHLDYHGSIESYARAKERLFFDLGPRVSVLFTGDPVGAELAHRAPGRVLRVGLDAESDVHPVAMKVDRKGIRGEIQLPSGRVAVSSRLLGRHNLDNLLVAFGLCEALGLDVGQAAQRLTSMPDAPGRLERCDGGGDDVTVVVDYAHTPDALARVLDAVRQLTDGKLWCVFGCGGDRDPGKRPKMGDAVGARADVAIVTNDNSRSEDPLSIIGAIEPGLARHRIAYSVVLDRAEAIEQAVAGAAAGDTVLIAGKGHEPYQIIGSERRPFDDRIEAQGALLRRRQRLGA